MTILFHYDPHEKLTLDQQFSLKFLENKFAIFDSKFPENYITDFQIENSFELTRARAFKRYIFWYTYIPYLQ